MRPNRTSANPVTSNPPHASPRTHQGRQEGFINILGLLDTPSTTQRHGLINTLGTGGGSDQAPHASLKEETAVGTTRLLQVLQLQVRPCLGVLQAFNSCERGGSGGVVIVVVVVVEHRREVRGGKEGALSGSPAAAAAPEPPLSINLLFP